MHVSLSNFISNTWILAGKVLSYMTILSISFLKNRQQILSAYLTQHTKILIHLSTLNKHAVIHPSYSGLPASSQDVAGTSGMHTSVKHMLNIVKRHFLRFLDENKQTSNNLSPRIHGLFCPLLSIPAFHFECFIDLFASICPSFENLF